MTKSQNKGKEHKAIGRERLNPSGLQGLDVALQSQKDNTINNNNTSNVGVFFPIYFEIKFTYYF